METSDAPAATNEAHKWAAICHASSLVGLLGNGIGFLLAPLIIWLMKRDEHPFINEQGKEAVNFQITVLILGVVFAILILVVIGIPLLIGLGLWVVIMPIVAAVKSSGGEHYRYPLTIRFIK